MHGRFEYSAAEQLEGCEKPREYALGRQLAGENAAQHPDPLIEPLPLCIRPAEQLKQFGEHSDTPLKLRYAIASKSCIVYHINKIEYKSDIDRSGRYDEEYWWVEYEMDDPASDVFSDSVSINLNKANDSYRFIDRSSPDFNLQLFLEIISNSLIAVIETVRSQDESFQCLSNPEEGSVAQALLYFRDVLEWDFTSPLTLSSSVRSFFEKNSNSI